MLHEHAPVAVLTALNDGATTADCVTTTALAARVYLQGVVTPACFELALTTLLDNDQRYDAHTGFPSCVEIIFNC